MRGQFAKEKNSTLDATSSKYVTVFIFQNTMAKLKYGNKYNDYSYILLFFKGNKEDVVCCAGYGVVGRVTERIKTTSAGSESACAAPCVCVVVA